MSIHSERYLQRFSGSSEPARTPVVGIEAIWLSEPIEPARDLAADLFAGKKRLPAGSRPPTPALLPRPSWGYDLEGFPVFNDRRCCAILLDRLSKALGRLQMPYDEACPGCRCVYRLQYTLVAEAPDGR